jgi:ribose transport system ATP-binding protein
MQLDGAPYQPIDPLDARRQGVAMVYQELSLVPHLSVAENVLMGEEPTTLGVLRRREMRARVAEVLREVGHPDLDAEARVGELSLAAQQIVEIARAVAQESCRADPRRANQQPDL